MDNPPAITAATPEPDKQAGAVAQALAGQEKSWGEKYKGKALHFIRDILVNYIINFIGSAFLTYKVDRSKFNQEKIQPFIERTALAGKNKYGIPHGLTAFVAKFFTRTQLLLCGGHAILPFMHWTHNHKKRLEFRVGHWLDSAQEFFGQGNAASRRSIEEYHRAASLVSLGDHNRKNRDGVSPELSDSDKALLAKNGLDEKLQFEERTKTWGQTIKARLFGMSVTTTMGVIMGVLSSFQEKGKYPFLWFEKNFEEPNGERIGKYVIAKIPGVRRIEDKTLIGKLMIDEMLFTGGSKLGFDRAEKKQLAKEDALLKKKEDARQTAAQKLAGKEQPATHVERSKERESTPTGMGVN